MSEQLLLDVSETAALLRLKESTIRSWILKRKLGYVKVGRRTFVQRSECDRIINAGVVPAERATERC